MKQDYNSKQMPLPQEFVLELRRPTRESRQMIYIPEVLLLVYAVWPLQIRAHLQRNQCQFSSTMNEQKNISSQITIKYIWRESRKRLNRLNMVEMNHFGDDGIESWAIMYRTTRLRWDNVTSLGYRKYINLMATVL